MTGFFERELRTPRCSNQTIQMALRQCVGVARAEVVATLYRHTPAIDNTTLGIERFVRAMSQRSPSASATGSRRADHNQWGSWDGWAGMAITALGWLGAGGSALKLAQDLSLNLAEGPFGQAHRVFGSGEGAAAAMVRPARKDQSWLAVCAGYIADGVLRGLFGFDPDPAAAFTVGATSAPRLRDPTVPRAFDGALRGVRYHGRLYSLVSNRSGVFAIEEQGPIGSKLR